MTLITEYDPPLGIAIYHLSTFADIGTFSNRYFHNKSFVLLDADGELEHILPVCMTTDCSDSRIYVRDNNEVGSNSIRIN